MEYFFAKNDNIIKTVNVKWSKAVNDFLNIAERIDSNFKIDDQNKRPLQLLLMYFTGDSSFPFEYKKTYADYGSLEKGVMLLGGVGTGKSLLFKIFKEYTSHELCKNSFQYYEAREIIDNVNVLGIDYLNLFNINGDSKHQNPITCYIDDIGSMNETVKHYGSEHNVIEQLLSMRYSILGRYKKLTHMSSNMYPPELEKMYGERIVDRMKEMFNIIELGGKSRRS